jgi:hypothetical protein
MRAFQSTYVGRNDFPKSLPDFLLRQCFTLNTRDRRAIRKTFRSRHWIGAALQLGFLGMNGTTLRSLEYVPAAVLRHLGQTRLCLGVGWSRPRATDYIGRTWQFRVVVRLRFLFAASFNPSHSKIIAICGGT